MTVGIFGDLFYVRPVANLKGASAGPTAVQGDDGHGRRVLRELREPAYELDALVGAWIWSLGVERDLPRRTSEASSMTARPGSTR